MSTAALRAVPSERTLRRRKHLTARQRAAQELAQELTFLADRFLDHRGDLFKLADRVLTQGTRSEDEEIKAVLKAIKYQEAHLAEEIAEDTGLQIARVKEIVQAMVTEGAARLEPRGW